MKERIHSASPSPPGTPKLQQLYTTGSAGSLPSAAASPSPPQPIPINMVGTPGRPVSSSTGSSVPPGIPIAQTPDRPPRVWAPHHNNNGGHHPAATTSSTSADSRQDVVIDTALEENALVGLDLSGMRIRSLPLGLLNYDFLQELRLNGNQLVTLPPAIGELRGLVSLDLSDNHISYLPPELGRLTSLVELLLFNNKLSCLPPELGYLYQVESIGLEGNPWDEPIVGVLATQGPLAVLPFLRDNLLVIEPPPDRIWQVLDNGAVTPGKDRFSLTAHLGNFTLMTFNILAEKYATPQMYGYVPTWFLSWEVRKQMILHEILTYDPDIVCLQEVEAGQFEQFFKPQLRMRGNYDGIFAPKSRARTMSEWDRNFVDGCAIFFKLDRFRLLEQQLIEFNQLALARPSLRKHRDMYNRVMTRDNIALIARLELLDAKQDLIIANVHIHWDPTFRDVKLVQAIMLAEELEKVMARVPRAALLVCGDLNSMPDSGVLHFLAGGSIGARHPDFQEHTYEPYSNEGARHRLELQSAYDQPSLAPEAVLPCTNFTPGFCGTIDYILYRPGPVTLTGVLAGIPPEYCKQLVGFPTQHQPSDHISLLAEFRCDVPGSPMSFQQQQQSPPLHPPLQSPVQYSIVASSNSTQSQQSQQSQQQQQQKRLYNFRTTASSNKPNK